MGNEKIEIVELCKICNYPRDDHDFAHEFSTDGKLHHRSSDHRSHDERMTGSPVTQGSPGNDMRGDPVLRMALIRKGLITVADLTQIEEELRMVGIATAQTVVKSGHS